MKRTFVILLLCSLVMCLTAQAGIYQQGTVVRMRVGECTLVPRHGFVSRLGANAAQAMPETCPEYTLVTDKVVYVIVGKSSNQLIPLAENIDFRLQHNELAVRVDDAKRETRFTIKEMMLRPDWEDQQRVHDEANSPTRRTVDSPMAMKNR